MRTNGLVALVLSGSLALAACSGSTDAAPAPARSAPSVATSSAAASPSAASPSTSSPSAGTTTDPDTCTVPEGLLDQDVERLPIKKKKVALTFDGGSGAEAAESILDTLEGRKAPGTFFLTGDFVRSFPDLAKRIADAHLVGNHTNTHPDLTTLTDDEIRAEVRKAERAIRRKTGEDPRRFFRFPFGARDEHTIDVVNDLCYVPFRWTVDTLGWQGTSGGQSVDSVVDRVLDGAEPGEVVLMHLGANPKDGTTLDADALPRIIKRLRAEGYSFVRLSRILDPAP